MHRRDLLVGGTGAGSLLVGGCAAGTDPRLVTPATFAETQAIEDRWRATMAVREAISARPRMKLDDVLPRRRSEGKLSLPDDLGRKAVRSLLVTSAFRDLSEDARVHPTVQAGVHQSMPEMDEAIFGVRDRLAALTATQRADIARELRNDPELGMRVLQQLDLEASSVGAEGARRLHMRTFGMRVCERLHESSEQLLGEYSEKLERVVARHGSDAETERKLATALGERAFTDLRERSFATYERHRTVLVARAADRRRVDGTAAAGEPETDPDAWTTQEKVLTVGGILCGFGVLLGVVALLILSSGGIAGVFVATAGAVILLGGLITLIVGLAIG
jgi:hypothetical protein